MKEPAVFMKKLANSQQLEKLFFFLNLRKIENQSSFPKGVF